MSDIFAPIGASLKYETITPGDTATGITNALLTSARGLQAKAAFISVEDETVTIAIDGGTATNAAGTNYGHKFIATSTLVLNGIDSLKNFSVVDTVSASAGTVKVTIFF